MTDKNEAEERLLWAMAEQEKGMQARLKLHLEQLALEEQEREVRVSWPGAAVLAVLGAAIVLAWEPGLLGSAWGLGATFGGMAIYAVLIRGLRLGPGLVRWEGAEDPDSSEAGPASPGSGPPPRPVT